MKVTMIVSNERNGKIFGYAFNWVNQLPVYVLAGMCGVVLILCCYLDISRVKADIDEINGLCENRL